MEDTHPEPVALEDQWRGVHHVQPELVEELVSYCNDRVNQAALAAWLDVAQRLVDQLWSGDLHAALAEDAAEHATWRALLRHEELRDPARVSRSRGLLRLRDQLPDHVFEGLAVSHLFVLLPIEDVDERRAIALRAFAEGWSVVRLREETEALRGGVVVPTVVRQARRSASALARLDVDAIAALPAEQARMELRALDEVLVAKRRAIRDVLGRVGGEH